MMESVLALAMIAQRVRFTLLPDHPVEPYPTFTLRPRCGIKAVIATRKEPEDNPQQAPSEPVRLGENR